jgi:hypothetical protein
LREYTASVDSRFLVFGEQVGKKIVFSFLTLVVTGILLFIIVAADFDTVTDVVLGAFVGWPSGLMLYLIWWDEIDRLIQRMV